MRIKVVNKYKENYDIYCGRGSALGNPYPIIKGDPNNTRDKVCDRYEVWFKEKVEAGDPAVMNQLKKIYRFAKTHGEVKLGCFCKPARCHCDTIARYVERQL